MTTYEAHKPTDIDRIGDIPAHWEVKKLKYTDQVIMGQSPNSEDYSVNQTGLPFLQGNAEFSSLHPQPRVYCDSANKIAEPQDILLSVRAPIGAVNIADRRYGIGRGLCAIRPVKSSSRFLFFHLLSRNEYLNSIGTGSTYSAISADEVRDLFVAFPPLEEQTAIAAYLDEKTSQLDTLLDRKRRLINLLREEKAALINDAVTKGIRPGVPMKDSGVDWLGEVPAHWEVKKLKHVATVRSGFALSGSMSNGNGVKYPYLRVANVQDGYLNLSTVTEVEIDEVVAQRFLLQSGDLLMNEGGDNDKLGRGCVWQGEIDPCLHQNHVFAVRMNPDTNPDWVNALTLTTYARQYFQIHCKQSTNLASISQTNIRELPVLMPPDTEQLGILAEVKEETARIDYTISRIEREMELIKEYRTALISEVVTGKVKVV